MEQDEQTAFKACVELINDGINTPHLRSEKDETLVCFGSIPVGEAEVYFEARRNSRLIVNM